jgi:hypothetical protein
MQTISNIQRGSLMLAEGTSLPPSVLIESVSYAPGWKLIENVTLQGFKELITQAGWHFLLLATEMKTTVCGWDKETALRKAIKRITAQAAKYNCVEITQVETRRFLNFPVVRITAHSRQIQEQGILAPGRARISYASE